MSTSISIVIPCYRSEISLPPLMKELDAVLGASEIKFEVIAVNDGSPDGTWQMLEKLAGEYAWLRPIDLLRNYGQHGAVLCGVREARHPITVTMDDDLQHPPSEIATLLAELERGNFGVVYGYPSEEKHSLWRVVAASLTKFALARFMGSEVARRVTSFRAFPTHLREAFSQYSGSFVSIDVLLTWATARFSAIPVNHQERELGESTYTVKKLATHALNMITGFSVMPLQVASLLGIAAFLVGLLLLAYILIGFFFGGSEVRGFTFLASSLVLFSGVQLLAIGIIGEYIARIHFQAMGKPPYVAKRGEQSGTKSGK